MAAKQNHAALWIAGGSVGLVALYELGLKKYVQQLFGKSVSPALPAPLTTPTNLPSSFPGNYAPGGIVGSIVDPRNSPGGDVGQAMWRKGWTAQQAQTRLDQLRTAYNTAKAAVAQLRAQTVNPAAASIPVAQNQLLLNQQALANAQTQQAQNAAAGDTLGAARWAAAAAAHAQDIRELQARINAASAPPDNAAAIAAYDGAIAGYKSDYRALTGNELV